MLPVSSCPAPQTVSKDKILLKARTVALRHGLSFGLSHEDAEDCAADFVLTLLQWQQTSRFRDFIPSQIRCRLSPEETERYLSTCARNFAFHRRRSLAELHRREQPLLPSGDIPDRFTLDARTAPPNRANMSTAKNIFDRGASLLQGETESAEVTVLTRLDQVSLWQNLVQSIMALSAAQRHVFVQYYLEDETLALIANRVGQSEPSVKQSLYRARLAVRSKLPRIKQK